MLLKPSQYHFPNIGATLWLNKAEIIFSLQLWPCGSDCELQLYKENVRFSADHSLFCLVGTSLILGHLSDMIFVTSITSSAGVKLFTLR